MEHGFSIKPRSTKKSCTREFIKAPTNLEFQEDHEAKTWNSFFLGIISSQGDDSPSSWELQASRNPIFASDCMSLPSNSKGFAYVDFWFASLYFPLNSDSLVLPSNVLLP